MIYFFTPYSLDFKLLDAITGCINLLQPDDWAVIMDGDTMFLQPDFGHQIQRHIDLFPEWTLYQLGFPVPLFCSGASWRGCEQGFYPVS
jgi:hypothetical protein